MNLLINSPFESISKAIASLREGKGKEKLALSWIDEAIRLGKGYITNLYFERILVYQHLVMEEDSKKMPDLKKRREALAKMKAATYVAQKYVRENKLIEWESRVYRFLGRLYDYEGNFSKSVVAYKKAIPLAKFDPEFVEKGYPRQFELEAFLSFALIMLGKVKEGVRLARAAFEKFDVSKEGKILRKKDYYTWAVWRSGIPIRTISALGIKKFVFNKNEMEVWLSEAEQSLNPPKGVKVWGDFNMRRDEIAALRRRLQNVN